MTPIALPPRDAHKLAKLCGVFGSDHAGERANAAAAADRLVQEYGLTWPIVLGVEKVTPAEISDYDRVAYLRAHAHLLTDWERQFVASIVGYLSRGRGLSARQKAVLDRIHTAARDKGGSAR